MKLFRLSTLCALVLAGVTGTLLFRTAQNVQEREAALEELRHAVKQEEESLRVLRAEWDYLNRPDRLETLAKTHLDLVPPVTGGKKTPAPATAREATASKPSVAATPAGGPPPDTRALEKIIEDSEKLKSFDEMMNGLAPAAGGTP